jgi:4-amino-4-deoxy-L-arabinose transferase-like glycosyltransferase
MLALLQKYQSYFFILILVFAIFIRFFKLGEVPIELNRDEASLGYTAYSLLKTGHEEHGAVWPVQIESFGDWKLPLYVYTLIPFIKLFGLAPWVIRLPSAMAGISIVVGSYWLVGKLVRDKKYQSWLQLLIPLLLAVSPWAVHFSHVAYEANLTLAVFLCGLIGVLTVLENFVKLKRRQIGLLIGSVSLFALTLLGYHSYQVFTPIFILGLWLIYRTEWQRFFASRRAWALGLLAPLVVVGGLLFWSGAQSANVTKFSGLSIFSFDAYTKVVNNSRMAFSDPGNPLFALAANKVGAFFLQVQTNFFHLISPEFLFLQGGANHGHNITGFGNLYPLTFFGLVVGIAAIIIERQKWQGLLGWWLLAASVAPMMTFEANHTTRFSPGFLVLEILSVYGWVKILQVIKKQLGANWFKLALATIIIGLTYSIYYFLIHYYFVFPVRDAQYWPWQMKTIVYFVSDVKDEYDAVYIQDERYSPYIYFLVYEPADPANLQSRIEYYPVDAEGFRHVRRLDNIYFQTIDWNDDQLYAGKKVLFIIEEGKIPDYNRSQEGTKLLMKLKNDWVPKGVDLWEIIGKPPEK